MKPLSELWHIMMLNTQLESHYMSEKSNQVLPVGEDLFLYRMKLALDTMISACEYCNSRLEKDFNWFPPLEDPGIIFSVSFAKWKDTFEKMVARYSAIKKYQKEPFCDCFFDTYLEKSFIYGCKYDLVVRTLQTNNKEIEKIIDEQQDNPLLFEFSRWANLVLTLFNLFSQRCDNITEEESIKMCEARSRVFRESLGEEVLQDTLKWLNKYSDEKKLDKIDWKLERLITDYENDDWKLMVEQAFDNSTLKFNKSEIGHFMLTHKGSYMARPDWDYMLLRKLYVVEILLEEKSRLEAGSTVESSDKKAQIEELVRNVFKACTPFAPLKQKYFAIIMKVLVDMKLVPGLNDMSKQKEFVQLLKRLGLITKSEETTVSNAIKNRARKWRNDFYNLKVTDKTPYWEWPEDYEDRLICIEIYNTFFSSIS